MDKRCDRCWSPVPPYRKPCVCHDRLYCDSHWDHAHPIPRTSRTFPRRRKALMQAPRALTRGSHPL